MAAALSDSSELEEHVQERGDSRDVSSDYSELDPLFAGAARSRHRGETSHSSTAMSLAQQASSVHVLPPTVVAPGSQLREYSGLAAATSASLDQRQVFKAGLVSGYPSAAYVESDSQLVEGGKPDQGGSKNYHSSHVLDIYESLREKLGCRAGSSTESPSTMQQLASKGSTGPAFNPGDRGAITTTTTASSAGDMGRGSWDQTPSDRDLRQWTRTRMHEMQENVPPVSAAQSIQGSWDRNQTEDGSCDLEELGIPSVNPWGDVGPRILAHDHDHEEEAERMEGIASLNWDDLGQAAEQTRPIELGMSTMKWSRNADGPQGMEGIESWGSMHMEGGNLGGPETAHVSAVHAPTISRSAWTPNTASGHDQLQIHNQWLSSGPGAPVQMLDTGHSQGSSDHDHIHSSGRGERELRNSANDLNPLLQHQSVSGNRSSYDYLWASSAMASPPLYVPSAFMRHIARVPFPYAPPEAGVVIENSGRQESAYRGMSSQDSNPNSGGTSNAAASAVDYMRLMSVADPNDTGHHQRRTSIFPPNESEHAADGELNFLLSSPGFFRMDSFPRHEVQSPSFSAPDATATRDTALHLFRANQAGATTVQVDSAFSAASLEAQRPPPVAQAPDKALQMQNHLKELSNMPMARQTDSPEPAGAEPIVRPSLHRTNAACLVEIVEDAGLDKEAARTR